MPMQPILKAAYGRKYHTFDEAETAYATGEDFVSQWGYCSCRDFIGKRVTVLFGSSHQIQMDICVLKQKDKS